MLALRSLRACGVARRPAASLSGALARVAVQSSRRVRVGAAATSHALPAARVGLRWLSAAPLADTVSTAVEQYIKWDPNPSTRAQAEEMLAAAQGGEGVAEVESAFTGRLAFGTAGLRGAMGAGTARMNDLSVLQAAQGLAVYLEDTFGDKGKTQGVVIGFDHRGADSLSSERFALYTAAAFLSRGFTVHLYPTMAFGVEELGCAAGVMVTASHNPRQDNGFKVYWSNGAQIIPPHDTLISDAINRNLEPWQDYDLDSVLSHPNCHDPFKEGSLDEKYIGQVTERLCRHKETNGDGGVKIAYTAMHGVGYPWIQRVFEQFGLPAVVPVPAQIHPDPAFPTVTLPNPEEGKGALALAMETADAEGATLILASDPDADRLAVAEKGADGAWTLLNGNDIGVLLGHWQWSKFAEENASKAEADRVPASDVYMMAPAVASKMLEAIAQAEGFNFEETLTGFKWAGNKTDLRRQDGKTVLFAYEPEIGFCVGDVVKDKDGVSAAAVFAEMAQHLATRGQTVLGHFAELKEKYGHFVNRNHYLICREQATLDRIFGRLRNDGAYWLRCGRWRVTGVRDLTTGVDTNTADGVPELPVSASSHYLTYYFDNGAVLTLRTSGTEPKLKYYSELSGADPVAAKAELDELVETVIQTMLEPEKNGLEFPADDA